MTEIRCKACGIRLYWADKDDLGDKLCWGCSQFEREVIADAEDELYQRAVREWEEDAAEVMQMVKEDERREP